jgi:hypothetical protein
MDTRLSSNRSVLPERENQVMREIEVEAVRRTYYLNCKRGNCPLAEREDVRDEMHVVLIKARGPTYLSLLAEEPDVVRAESIAHAANKACQDIRGNYHPAVPLDNVNPQEFSTPETAASEAAASEGTGEALKTEFNNVLHALWNTRYEAMRVLYLNVYDGKTYKEALAIVGLPYQTFKRHRQKIRDRLAKVYRGYCGGN